MFKIKSEQIRVFQPDAEEAFLQSVTEFVRENHGDAGVGLPNGQILPVAELSEKMLREMCRRGILRGRELRIEWKSTLQAFVVLLFITAPNFDEHPKVSSFFVGAETVDDTALESLLDEMTDEDWDEVEKNYDPEAWHLLFDEEAKI